MPSDAEPYSQRRRLFPPSGQSQIGQKRKLVANDGGDDAADEVAPRAWGTLRDLRLPTVAEATAGAAAPAPCAPLLECLLLRLL